MIAFSVRGFANYMRSIWDYRYFWYSLVKADLQRRYRRSFIGVGWSLLSPVLMTVILSSVYQHILNLRLEFYGPFLMTGMAYWGFISGVVNQGCNCFKHAESYIRQEPAPIAIYPLRTVMSVGFNSLIAMLAAIGLSAVVGSVPNPLTLLSLIPVFTLLFLMAWCIATIFGLLNVYFPDVQYLSEVGLQIMFFLCPIVYPPKLLEGKGMGEFLQYNPIAVMLELIRVPVQQAEFPPLEPFLAMCAFVCLLTVLTGVLLKKMERKVIFEL